MIKFTIPGRLPGMNEYTETTRRNRYAGAKMKRDAQTKAAWAVKAAHLQPAKIPVRLRYRFYEPNKKRDKDNVAGFAHKVIQDALVSCGVLPDDGWDEITGFTDDFGVDKRNPRIEVEIKEAAE